MKKDDFTTQVIKLLKSIEGVKDEEKKTENSEKSKVLDKIKENTKTKDKYKFIIETLNDGNDLNCDIKIDHMSFGGAFVFLDVLDRIKEYIFKKMPEVKKNYGTSEHKLATKMARLFGDLVGALDLIDNFNDNDDCDNECDGDCDGDE